jgi:FKBP-type peptidyl-prolyl cis-trans isomerase (trigger factor)
VKGSLILRAIGDKENITASEDEVRKEVDNFLKRYPDIKSAQKEFDQGRLEEYTKEVIRNEKILKLLESFVKNI